MAGPDGSAKVVVLALLANAGIAVAKLVAGLITGSAAMLAEAVHSAADSGNQLLLLLGMRRARRPRDRQHPLGYGRESFFWAMLVAVVLFTLGGVYSLVEGASKLTSPHPIESPAWALGVLALALLLEGASLRAAWLVCKRVRGDTPLLTWARDTGDVNLLVVVFEDLAAMIGLLLASAAVGGAVLLDAPVLDALGTLAIGLLLIGVAVFLANQIRRLVVGFRASRSIEEGIDGMWTAAGFDVLELATTWSGPRQVMVVAKVRPRDLTLPAGELIGRINTVERSIYVAHPEVRQLFVEPDIRASTGPVA